MRKSTANVAFELSDDGLILGVPVFQSRAAAIDFADSLTTEVLSEWVGGMRAAEARRRDADDILSAAKEAAILIAQGVRVDGVSPGLVLLSGREAPAGLTPVDGGFVTASGVVVRPKGSNL